MCHPQSYDVGVSGIGTYHRHYDRKISTDPDRHSLKEQDSVIACVRVSALGIFYG
jgi:hypothetical protein